MNLSRRALFGGLGAAVLSRFLPKLEAGEKLPESGYPARLRAMADALESSQAKLLKYEMISTFDGKAVLRMDVKHVNLEESQEGVKLIWTGKSTIPEGSNVSGHHINGLQLVSPDGVVWQARPYADIIMRPGDTLEMKYTFNCGMTF